MSQTLNDFLNSPKVLKKSPNTRKAYERDLFLFEQYINKYNVSLDRLNDMVVQTYLDQMKTKDGQPSSPATKNRTLASIATFCHWSKQLEAVQEIDIPKIPHISKQPSKGLCKDEVTSLRLKVANDHNPNKLRNQAIIDLLIYSGFRVSELVSLDRDDIKYHKGIYTITVYETKNNEVKKAYLDSKKFKYIKKYLESRTDNEEALFISGRNQRISIRMVQTILNKYGINPHLLRHTFCSILARDKVDPFTIAQLAGHRDLNTTRRYANPNSSEMAEMVSKAFNF
ncbi:tyrosine-type recombinase/integrase [Desulfosporosinus youngiae]|uniref:Site-specific recombinase XerD n=1 Tax=Desulfosporosinus youngiae DSM 17734 TaxID=768710 RepID=H5Y575_9FIRM|nr:tyrosine-type recombinase/integrase [Desulfosporosinus youngiae]EHQ90179.1 site-specific recombinase XerD [Desulfosporosinus youngiae DSM 17734]